MKEIEQPTARQSFVQRLWLAWRHLSVVVFERYGRDIALTIGFPDDAQQANLPTDSLKIATSSRHRDTARNGLDNFIVFDEWR
ncbi:hypothetical protein [Burkholderia multivorans]|uniref:hypothetical protein n=1 Tax=Burkholderia multivorans TaxID=87883 RepID=UPI0006A6373B|nr:hypothetical protein [Burkholderia multivorans]KOE24560.1 hypothetical protein AI46_18285 [Burkholderia multivorans R-20526]MBU9246499.1 hypothetical protein [Burkholderia multivorans]